MHALQLLLVEDDIRLVESYKTVLADYVEERGRQLELHVVNSLDDAKRGLGKWIDAAIVDLNLGSGTSDGGEIIKQLKKYFRVPVAVLTGTPDDAENVPPVVGIFTKGEHRFDEVLDRLWSVHEIGLTKIMGGRGLLEERLNRVFLKNLLPTVDVWIRYAAKDRKRTERALLRYALGHLVADLEGDDTPCYPEEVYLAPPLDDSLETGSLVRCKARQTWHVVMTPACDLVIRKDGDPKTDMVVLAEVVPEVDVFDLLKANNRQKKKLRRNNDASYLHWLPKCHALEGGFVNFRRLDTVAWNELDEKFDRENMRVAPSFIKDMVSRFSTFYARQGQPEIVASNS
ncbi:MAG: hypothetical protein OXN97_18695 [Bryobacterales bacterium]|nr:hypothetical protein [Bryobacterales bacterium]MDE0628174.1 hypothetical protein [Bryobacterales bacterium]